MASTNAPAGVIHPVDRHVGRRVAEKRIMLGHNQSDLGKALGVSFQQIQKYEKGTNRISASKLWAIAEFLNVDIRHFFEGLESSANAHAESVEVVTSPVTRASVDINRLAPRLSPAQQRMVLDLMREFAANEPLSHAT